MSTAVEIKRDDSKTMSLVPIPFNPLTNIEKLEAVERSVIANLANQSEDEILDTRRKSKELGKTAWRIEAACDAQIIARADNMRKGRGFIDTEGRGSLAAVTKRSKQIGCTPNTIYENSRIFRFIKEVESIKPENITLLNLLDEKGFFKVALKYASEPDVAILLFAQKKKILPQFRVSDAFRLLESQDLLKKVNTAKALSAARLSIPGRDAEISYVAETISKTKNFSIPNCPYPEVVRIHEAFIEELEDYLRYSLFDKDVSSAIHKAWDAGYHREAQISKYTGFPHDVVSREMGLLGELGEFIKVPGPGSQRWHKVGEPLPQELRLRQA